MQKFWIFVSIFLISSASSAKSELHVEVRQLSGGATVLNRLVGPAGLVLVAREGGCPISERYGPRLKEYETRYRKKGIEFAYLYVGQVDIAKLAAKDKKQFQFRGSYLVDSDLTVAKHYDLKTTTELLFFNAEGRLIYRGAVDDQHSLAGAKPAPKELYLQWALDSSLAGQSPSIVKTEAPGCFINYITQPSVSKKKPTFNQDVFPILDRKCIQCHRSGNELKLMTYEDVRGRAKMIRHVIESKLMPPWSMKPHLGPWINDLSLTPGEETVLLDWLKSDMPEGSGRVAATVDASENWAMGEPDAVIRLPRPFKVPATGSLEYQHFIFDSPFKKDVWVQGFEILTLSDVVHHATMHVLKDGNNRDPKMFYSNDVSRFQWALGNFPSRFPPHVGSRIPKGSKIAITVHYNPNGKEVLDDQTRFGFKFLQGKPLFERKKIDIEDLEVNIPANASNHLITLRHKVDADVFILSLNAHMHLRGRSAKITAKFPDGKVETLLDIDPYRFKFQLIYNYIEPRFLPKGTEIICENHFDNSEKNPLNPDPSKTVTWGDQTIDEMSICSLEIFQKI